MTLTRLGRRLAPAVLALVLAACGGGGGGGGGAVGVPGADPVSTVNSLVATIQAKAFDKLPDLACAASKGQISQAFDPSSGLASGLGAAGLTASDVLGAMSISLDNVQVGSPSVSGDTATVHVKGNMKVAMDPGKFAAVMKKAMTAAGQPADDATINAIISAASSSLSQTTTLDSDVTLKNEGGKWLICQ